MNKIIVNDSEEEYYSCNEDEGDLDEGVYEVGGKLFYYDCNEYYEESPHEKCGAKDGTFYDSTSGSYWKPMKKSKGKIKKSNYKLSNIKLNCEPGELVLLCSLSDLKKKENLEKIKNFFSDDFPDRETKDHYGARYPYGDCHLFNAVPSDSKKPTEEYLYQDAEKKNYIESCQLKNMCLF